MIYKIILASLKEAEKFRYSNGGLVRIKKEGHNEHDVEAVMGLFSGLRRKDYPTSVSYTHLTLPTTRRV